MEPKTYYELLEIPPTASAEVIKRAFRQQIARYHPDKVQHLGREFQEMAAGRAAELTEAYRVLSDERARAEYDRAGHDAAGPAPKAQPAPPAVDPQEPAATSTAASPPADSRPAQGPLFSHERATRDHVLRKAIVGRLRQAVEAIAGGYEESQAHGFDLVWLPKSTLFGRGKGPRLVVRFVARVDGDGVAEAWVQAGQWAKNEEVCVFLIGPSMAPAGELAAAIAEQRRKGRAWAVTLVPVDARTWDAHLPTDAPVVAKTLLARLAMGT